MYTMCSVLYMCICISRRGSETPEKLIYTHISINLCNQVAKNLNLSKGTPPFDKQIPEFAPKKFASTCMLIYTGRCFV